MDILTIAICATICGADSWVHIELFGRSKLAWFQSFLELPHGIPSHDTFGDVFARLDPVQLQNCFISWTQAIAELLPGEVVAIDGKTARRSYDRAGNKGGYPQGQVKTDEKSNEITAIPQLLDLHGCIVTIDAMGCQREIAQQIIQGGADYVLAVKENQGQLHESIQDLFEGAEAFGFDGVSHDHTETVDKGHGRVERRECWVITDQDGLDYLDPQGQWPQLKAAVRVVGHRQTHEGAIRQPRYYISSLAASAEQLPGRHQKPLEHRKLVALDPGRDLSGRSVPSAQGPWRTEHQHPAADRTQPAEERDNPESGHPGQTPQRRLG